MFPRTVPVLLGLILLSAPLLTLSADAQEMNGRRVAFEAVNFNDTLFASIDSAYRVVFDEDGNLWYSTGAGVVHVDVDDRTRRLYTHVDGLPSSLALGLAVTPETVYVATDLGLALIDRATDNITVVPSSQDGLPDTFIEDVAVVGDKVWVATHFFGLAQWDPVDDSWAVKNTSTKPGHASPIKRIVVTGDDVWLATRGDGVWRYDRNLPFESDAAWRVLLKEDGLPSNNVYAVAERFDNVYFGTNKGLMRWAGMNPDAAPEDEWLLYNESNGLPDDLVVDVDVIPTTGGTVDVFASTPAGIWQFNPANGSQNAVLAQSFGILGTNVHDSTVTGSGWAIATTRGVSLLRGGEWSYYTTGPSMGASPGPGAFFLTSGSVGDSPYLWFGSGAGLSAFDPAGRGGKGAWYHVGEWHYYPGSIINHIDSEGGITWIGTSKGTYGFNPETGEWMERLASAPSRNLVYGLDADGSELWIALFGDGLIMQDLATNTSRSWDARIDPTVPPSFATLTDVRVQGNDVWLGSGDGLVRMSRVAGTVTATYTIGDGLPGNGIVFRTLPDGGNVWVGMQDGGLAQLDVAKGKVTRTWNWTSEPGFPTGEIRSLHREGSRLWAGFGCSSSWKHEEPCTAGLARVDVITGEWKAYTQQNSKLVQSYVNGIMSHDGILYLATASGAARLDIDADEFLPMHIPLAKAGEEGEDSANATRNETTARTSLRITTPRDGAAVAGPVELTGTASRFGGAIERVEVRVGQGEWTTATGIDSWSFVWDASAVEGPVTLAARAIVDGEPTRPVEILVTAVRPPDEPLALQHNPSESWTAGKAYPLRVIASGDDPLTVSAYYQKPGEGAYTRIDLARDGNAFRGEIPARHVKEGQLTYYVEARSGLLSLTSPEDPARPHQIPIGAPPRLAVGIEGPSAVAVDAGATLRFELNLTNTGTDPASFQVQPSGLRASWVSLNEDALRVEPGETKRVAVSVHVPERAIAGLTNFTFVVRDTTGVAEPASTTVGVQIASLATNSADTVDAPTDGGRRGWFGIPSPGLVPVLAALLVAAIVSRRWTP